MKILFIGDYSNVHATLALGLRALGHQVLVISDGNRWRNYARDIDLTRNYSKFGRIKYFLKLLSLLPKLKGFDIVQLICPTFIDLKAKRILPIYKYLKRNNKCIILDALSTDSYWIKACREYKHLRYSDFNFGKELRKDDSALAFEDWIGTSKEQLNTYIAKTCDKIIASLYEYYTSYMFYYPHKTVFIPLPIQTKKEYSHYKKGNKIQIFIGIDKARSVYKGTDIMLKAAYEIEKKYPSRVSLQIAESLPFSLYTELMNNSDIILDQLYSYTPAMNALEAMSKGIICVGGAEEEQYHLMKENTLRPIINVLPNERSVFEALENIILHPEKIASLQQDSITYISRHHDHIKVAKAYEQIYLNVLKNK